MARTKQAARDKSWEEKKAKRAAAVQQLAKAKAGDDIEVFARAYFAALRHATPGVLRDEFEALLREAPDGRATEATTELLEMVAALLRDGSPARTQAKAARQASIQRLKDAKAGDDIEVFTRAYFAALRHATPGVLRAEFEALLREAPVGRATEATTELLAMVEAVLGRIRECNKAKSARGKTACEAAFQQFEDAKAGDDIEAFARAYFAALRHATPGVLRAEFTALLRKAPAGRATEALMELLDMVEALLRRNAEDRNARNRAKRAERHRRLRSVVAEGKVLDVPAHLNEKRAVAIASIDDEVTCCVEINQ